MPALRPLRAPSPSLLAHLPSPPRARRPLHGLALVARAGACALALAASGCASAAWHPRVDSVVGEYRNVEPLNHAAEGADEGTADDVKAIVLELPDGITLENDVLRVDAARYEVLGKVAAEPAGDFFYPYREGWRRPFCYPQRVLTVATLFVWMAVPTSWPCFVSAGSVDDRRDRIVEAMKRATKALGGNLVLVGGFGGTVVIRKSGSASAVVSTMEATQGVGWAIRAKGGVGAPAPTQAPSRSPGDAVPGTEAREAGRPTTL